MSLSSSPPGSLSSPPGSLSASVSSGVASRSSRSTKPQAQPGKGRIAREKRENDEEEVYAGLCARFDECINQRIIGCNLVDMSDPVVLAGRLRQLAIVMRQIHTELEPERTTSKDNAQRMAGVVLGRAKPTVDGKNVKLDKDSKSDNKGDRFSGTEVDEGDDYDDDVKSQGEPGKPNGRNGAALGAQFQGTGLFMGVSCEEPGLIRELLRGEPYIHVLSMDVGDYLMWNDGPQYVHERKTLSDLSGDLERWHSQRTRALDVRTSFPRVRFGLLLELSGDDPGGLSPNIMATIAAETIYGWDMHMWRSADPLDSLLLMLAGFRSYVHNNIQTDDSGLVRFRNRRQKIERSLLPPRESIELARRKGQDSGRAPADYLTDGRILCAQLRVFPGVSSEQAAALAWVYPSVSALRSAATEYGTRAFECVFFTPDSKSVDEYGVITCGIVSLDADPSRERHDGLLPRPLSSSSSAKSSLLDTCLQRKKSVEPAKSSRKPTPKSKRSKKVTSEDDTSDDEPMVLYHRLSDVAKPVSSSSSSSSSSSLPSLTSMSSSSSSSSSTLKFRSSMSTSGSATCSASSLSSTSVSSSSSISSASVSSEPQVTKLTVKERAVRKRRAPPGVSFINHPVAELLTSFYSA